MMKDVDEQPPEEIFRVRSGKSQAQERLSLSMWGCHHPSVWICSHLQPLQAPYSPNPPHIGMINFFLGGWLHLRHMEVPRLGVELELQLPAYATATATATADPAHVYDLQHSSWECRLLKSLSGARD